MWLFLFFSTVQVFAQDSKKEKQAKEEARIAALVEQQHYTFVAETALPMGMRSRILTGEYDLVVSKDTLSSYLPYFGKLYSAPIGSDNGGIQFKTTDFKYSAVPAKKGGWNITINPKNAGDTRQLTLYISTSGYASLQVNCNNRQSISFNGHIK